MFYVLCTAHSHYDSLAAARANDDDWPGRQSGHITLLCDTPGAARVVATSYRCKSAALGLRGSMSGYASRPIAPVSCVCVRRAAKADADARSLVRVLNDQNLFAVGRSAAAAPYFFSKKQRTDGNFVYIYKPYMCIERRRRPT